MAVSEGCLVEMFPVFLVLFPVCSQSWRNGFLKFPVFQASCSDPYWRGALMRTILFKNREHWEQWEHN